MLWFIFAIAALIHRCTTSTSKSAIIIQEVSAANCGLRHSSSWINRTFESVVSSEVGTFITGDLMETLKMFYCHLRHSN